MSGQLLDFSADLVDPQAIRDAGYVGVIGYVSAHRPGAEWMRAKPITKAYCDHLRAAGLEIVSNYQFGKGATSDWRGGYDAGVFHAHTALRFHDAAGGPDTAPIYAPVDDNPTLAEWNELIAPFLKGWASVVGLARTGMYGNSVCIDWALEDGVATYFWQHNWGTPKGFVHPDAHIHQFEIDKRSVGGIGVDVSNILKPDYGQWSIHVAGGSVNKPSFTEINRVGDSGNSRGGVQPKWFLLHTQEGNGTAESLAAYLNNPNNGVSYHYTIDNSVTVVDVVDTDDASWSVLDANNRAINLCFAGSRASWGPTQWIENMGNAIDVAAYVAVQDCKKYGIPPHIITPAQLGNGMPGIADHWAITSGLGIGSHTDVGDGFPWDRFARSVDKYAQKESPMSVADYELSKKFPSRSKYRDSDEPIDTLAGFILNIDARIHEEFVEYEALKGVSWAVALVKRLADAGDEGARAVFAEIQEGKE